MGISMDSDFPQAELRHSTDQVAKGPSELESEGGGAGAGVEAHRFHGVHGTRCTHILNRILILHILEIGQKETNNYKYLLPSEDFTRSPKRKIF